MLVKNFIVRHAFILILLAVFLLFVILFGAYYYTRTQLKPTELANKYGYELQEKAHEIKAKIPDLIRSGEVNNCDLIKVVAEQKFNNVQYDSIVIDSEDGVNYVAMRDEKLPANSMLIKQYSVESYYYLESIDAGYEPHEISYDSGVLSIVCGKFADIPRELRIATIHGRLLKLFSKQPKEFKTILIPWLNSDPIVAIYYN